MLPTSPAGSAALYVLRQATAQQFGPTSANPPIEHHAAAVPDASEPAGDRDFGMNTMDITATKVRLMERLGEKFDISMEDHADARSFGMAIAAVVDKLRLSGDGVKVLAQVTKDLGLDELGISIDTLVGAVIDPESDEGEKLDAALRAVKGEVTPDRYEAKSLARLARMGLDDAGLYRIRG
jgi:hypothetical protein